MRELFYSHTLVGIALNTFYKVGVTNLMDDFILDNQSNVPDDEIINLLKKVNLPQGRIILLLTDKTRLESLGECIPKCLIDYAGRRRYFRQDYWECGVILSQKACNIHDEYPAYFMYLLGHELGHAHICLTDVYLHIHYCLIQDFIRDASNNKILGWHELPHEIKMDQYGLFITEMIYSRKEINQQIKKIINLPDCKDKTRLEQLLTLPSSNELSGLREELIDFSLPYKDKLIELWKKDAQESSDRNDLAITRLVKDYDALFDKGGYIE